MAKGFGTPRPAKFKSHFKTGFVSKWGKPPKAPGPPKPKAKMMPKITKLKFSKVGRI